MAKFVHLHIHTEYSLLDGLCKIKKLLSHTKQLGMDALAITDHGAMYGVIEFYKNALKEGIKPIIGMEAYTTDIDHRLKVERGKSRNYHLLLLAKNNQGYKNLMKLTSIAHIEGYYYKPRFDKNTLAKYSRGLICTSSCPMGELPQALIDGDYDRAKEIASWFLDVFGKDYYLEIQRHEYEKYVKEIKNEELRNMVMQSSENEKIVNDGIVKLSRELGIPILATNDVHYIKKEDAFAQDTLVCIATAKNISDIKRMRFIDSPTFYLRSPEEMSQLFRDLPEALENTLRVVDSCDLKITLDRWFFPEYELEEGITAEEELKKRVLEGAKNRFNKITPEIKRRLDYELDTIIRKGYATYFLIVADMAEFARKKGIITNTRGSAAGSLVSYTLGIININPLDYDLPFERFLTPWRPSPPDIDFDIADDRREEVIEYITKKYGSDRVAQICTFGRMLARGSVRDVARVLGYPYSVGDRIAKTIPIGSQGFPMTIERALQESIELKNLYENDADAKKIIDLAKQIEGNARHVSVHAAGVVIAPEEITNYTPIQLDPEGKKVITQYDMDALDPNVSPNEAVGLLKFDLLGLRNLSILGSTIKIIKDTRNVDIDLTKIPLSDKKTFEMLSRGETMGVFQLSGSGMTRYLKELKPTRVEDLMVMVALYRPGPMAQIPEYIRRKNDPSKVTYFDPRMKEYLQKSYGLLVYQDDVFMTAIKIAGYTWEEADKFRKAVGKKIPEEMEKQKDKFIKGAVQNGLSKEKAEELFKLIEPFSGYGFNKAHAASYGMVAYWTAYLKANFPVEFMSALLSAESGDNDKVALAINECRRMGINVLPPDINESGVDFTIVKDPTSLEGKAIRFGLNAIKNVGKAAIEAILSERAKSKFKSFADFISRVDTRKVNKKVVESLIKVGALSSFGKRSVLLSSIDKIRSTVVKPKNFENQEGLFTQEDVLSDDPIPDNTLDDQIEEFSEEEIQNLERQLLGFSLSARPISELISKFSKFATHKINELTPVDVSVKNVKISAIISEIRVIVTRSSGQEMAFLKISDDTGSIELVVFPSLYKRISQNLSENRPILVSGKLDLRDETLSIIAEDIQTELPEDPQEGTYFIRIPPNCSPEKLRMLKSLLLENPGDVKVCLVFEGDPPRRMDLDLRISLTQELSREIAFILNSQTTDS